MLRSILTRFNVSNKDSGPLRPSTSETGFDHLSDMLVLTNLPRLERKLGARPTVALLNQLSRVAAVESVIDPLEEPSLRDVDAALRRNPGAKAVVIIGGYDILAPDRADVREEPDFAVDTIDDYDREFLAWTDDCYGDWESLNRGRPEAVLVPRLPVSRVPDANSVEFLRALLTARPAPAQLPFGLRNQHRVFAEEVFDLLTPSRMLQSLPVRHRGTPAAELAGDRLYIVLHGYPEETMRWYGEDDHHRPICAVTKKNVASLGGAVVFSAACFGACLGKPAHLLRANERPKHVDRLPISLLRAGASAVVGVTSVHHSPHVPIPHRKYLAQPLHEAFWRGIVSGLAPAAALHLAKKEYARGLHFTKEAEHWADQARERLTLYQFGCLGTGW